MGRDEEDSSKTVERNSLDLSRPSVLEILEINLQHDLDVIDVPEAVSNRRRVVALDSGPSGNWESCSARRSFLTFGIFGWTWYHSSGLVKPCFVVVRQIWCIYIYKYLARIYLKSKAQRRRRRFDISFECRCRISWLQLQKGNVFQWCEVNTSQTRRESEERGVAKRKRLQVACAQSCFRHLWLRMLTKFAAKVLVFMACFGLKRVHNHGSQQCIRFQKQTPDLKIHSLITRPSLSFVFWKRSPTSFIEDEEGNHRLCLFSDSTWHFFLRTWANECRPRTCRLLTWLQIFADLAGISRIIAHQWTWMNQLCLTGWQKKIQSWYASLISLLLS